MLLSIKADGTTCETEVAAATGFGTRAPLITGAASSWKTDRKDECNTAKELGITLEAPGGGRPGACPVADRAGGL